MGDIRRIDQIIQSNKNQFLPVLHLVIQYGDSELVEHFLALNRQFPVENERGNTPLHYAKIKGSKKIVEAVSSMDLNLTTFTGFTANEIPLCPIASICLNPSLEFEKKHQILKEKKPQQFQLLSSLFRYYLKQYGNLLTAFPNISPREQEQLVKLFKEEICSELIVGSDPCSLFNGFIHSALYHFWLNLENTKKNFTPINQPKPNNELNQPSSNHLQAFFHAVAVFQDVVMHVFMLAQLLSMIYLGENIYDQRPEVTQAFEELLTNFNVNNFDEANLIGDYYNCYWTILTKYYINDSPSMDTVSALKAQLAYLSSIHSANVLDIQKLEKQLIEELVSKKLAQTQQKMSTAALIDYPRQEAMKNLMGKEKTRQTTISSPSASASVPMDIVDSTEPLDKNKEEDSSQSLLRLVYQKDVSDVSYLLTLMKIFPELQYFKDLLSYTVDKSGRIRDVNPSLLKQLFEEDGKIDTWSTFKLSEVNKTFLRLLYLRSFIQNDHSYFPALSDDRFQRFRKLLQPFTTDEHRLRYLIVSLVLDDLGRTEAIQEAVRQKKDNTDALEPQVDHDTCLRDFITQHYHSSLHEDQQRFNELLPSFKKYLSPLFQDLYIHQINNHFNLGAFVQGESTIFAIYDFYKQTENQISTRLIVLFMAFMPFIYNSEFKASGFNDVLFDQYMTAAEIILQVKQRDLSDVTSSLQISSGLDPLQRKSLYLYEQYLSKRAQMVGIPANEPFQSPEERFALYRIVASCRCSAPLHWKKVRYVWDRLLDAETKNALVYYLNVTGFIDGEKAIYIYYAPAIIANAIAAVKEIKHPYDQEDLEESKFCFDFWTVGVYYGLQALVLVYQAESKKLKEADEGKEEGSGRGGEVLYNAELIADKMLRLHYRYRRLVHRGLLFNQASTKPSDITIPPNLHFDTYFCHDVYDLIGGNTENEQPHPIQGMMDFPKGDTTLKRKHEHDGVVSQPDIAALAEDAERNVKQRKYEKAESLYVLLLEKKQSLLGEDDAVTLSTMLNLGEVYMCQGKYKEAQPLFETCYDKYRSLEDHHDRLRSMRKLTDLYMCQGDLEKAQPLYEACYNQMEIY